MLKPSDFNNAVPKFQNGTYANNPLDPTDVAEPTMEDYVRGVEPLDTLPAQWWNWLCNQFTSRFNKINTYVKNVFDELTQLLSLVGVTPDGTEGTITTGQLKNAFEQKYPNFLSKFIHTIAQIWSYTGTSTSGAVTTTQASRLAVFEKVTASDSSTSPATVTETYNTKYVDTLPVRLGGTGANTKQGALANLTCELTCPATLPTTADVIINNNGVVQKTPVSSIVSYAGTVSIQNSTADSAIPVALCTGFTNVGKSSCCPLTYNPATGALVAGNIIYIGCYNFCTPTQAGSSSLEIKRGAIELNHTNPFLDFHHNYYCGDYSARIINDIAGCVKLTVNNGTGCTQATSTGDFHFCSDGYLYGNIRGLYKSVCDNGVQIDSWGNLKHMVTCTADTWSVFSNNGTASLCVSLENGDVFVNRTLCAYNCVNTTCVNASCCVCTSCVTAIDPGSTASKVCNLTLQAFSTNASCVKATQQIVFNGETGQICWNIKDCTFDKCIKTECYGLLPNDIRMNNGGLMSYISVMAFCTACAVCDFRAGLSCFTNFGVIGTMILDGDLCPISFITCSSNVFSFYKPTSTSPFKTLCATATSTLSANCISTLHLMSLR